jgi:transketolase C-terminal domain/subunit
MVGLAHGIANTDPECKVIVHYGDAFINRPADMLNAMAQVNTPNVLFIGTNGGLSAALNGFTHQSSGQPAMLQFMSGMKFYEPGDPIDAVRSFNEAINATLNPQYIRYHGLPTFAMETQKNLETDFWRVVHLSEGEDPSIILVGSGLTLKGVYEAGLEYGRCVVIDVIDPTNLSGIADILPEGIPILTFYNGTPEILGAWVALELLKHPEKRWGKLHYFGFAVGTSAPLKVVINHFGLDKEGVLGAIRSIQGE